MSTTQPSFTLSTVPLSVLDSLPPLPLINDAGGHDGAKGEDPSYKRLEHAGDVVISTTLEAVMLAALPQLSVGRLTTLQAQLKSNQLLAQLSVHYGLPDLIICHAAERHTLVNNQTTQAELFEAHIGGLITAGAIGAVDTLHSANMIPLGDDTLEHITPQVPNEEARIQGHVESHSFLRSLVHVLLPWALGQLYADESHVNTLGGSDPGSQALVPANSVATMTRQEIDRHAFGARQCVNQYFDVDGRGSYDPTVQSNGSSFIGIYTVTLPDGQVLVEMDQRVRKQYALAAAAYRMGRRLGIIAPPL